MLACFLFPEMASVSGKGFNCRLHFVFSSTTNCMTSRTSNYNASALDVFANDVPGQVYDADYQCVESQGEGSYLYRVSCSFYCQTTYSFSASEAGCRGFGPSIRSYVNLDGSGLQRVYKEIGPFLAPREKNLSAISLYLFLI